METNVPGPPMMGARAESNQRNGRIVAVLLLAATLMMWMSVRGTEENCTTFGLSPQAASLSTVGQTPIGCTG